MKFRVKIDRIDDGGVVTHQIVNECGAADVESDLPQGGSLMVAIQRAMAAARVLLPGETPAPLDMVVHLVRSQNAKVDTLRALCWAWHLWDGDGDFDDLVELQIDALGLNAKTPAALLELLRTNYPGQFAFEDRDG